MYYKKIKIMFKTYLIIRRRFFAKVECKSFFDVSPIDGDVIIAIGSVYDAMKDKEDKATHHHL